MTLPAPPATIDELCDRAERWAADYYPSSPEAKVIHHALKPLRELAGYDAPESIGADLLTDCQHHLVQQGLARSSVNAYVRKIRTVLKWAAKPPRRWVPPAALADAALVDPLAAGRTQAPEGPGRDPVPWEHVQAMRLASPPWLSVMVWVHWHTGARPSEVVALRRSQMTERDGCLVFTLKEHKTRASTHRHRHIVVGPKGREQLDPWLAVTHADQLFEVKTEDAYRQAVKRICARNNIPPWCPAQIRHSYLTRVGMTDLEGARAVAGHTSTATTLIYADIDLARAVLLQQAVG